MAIVVMPLGASAGHRRSLGVRVAGAAGLSLMAVGFAILSQLEVGSSY